MNARERMSEASHKTVKKWCIVPLVMVALLAAFLLLTSLAVSLASPGWSTREVISDYPDWGEYAKIAVDSSGVSHVAWYNWDYDEIWYNSGTPGDWGSPVLLSTQSGYAQYNPEIALDPDGNAHVVWYGYDAGENDYYIWYATNAGGSWSDPVNISTQSGYSQYDPKIAIDSGGNVYLVWCGYDAGENDYYIWYATNAGGSWSDPVNISTQSDYTQYDPWIALDSNGNAHVAWYGYDAGDNYYAVWYATNAGGSWSDPDLLSTQSGYDQYDPQVGVDSSGNAHVVWYGYDPDDNYEQVYYATNAGGTWSAPVLVSTGLDDDDQEYSQMAMDPSGNVYVAWQSYYGEEIYYATNAGGTWSAPRLLSTMNGYGQWEPKIAVDFCGKVHVTWYGYDNDDYYYEIWYTYFSGGSWSSPEMLSSNSDYFDAYYPDIALDRDGNPYIVWDDYDWDDEYGYYYMDLITFRADISQRIVNATVEGAGGTVDPVCQAVPIGGTATVNLIPDEGYSVESVTDNGVLVTPTPTDSYTITNINEHHEVVVTFIEAAAAWYLAEGCTAPGFETWILVENPGDTDAAVSLEFDTDLGGVAFLNLRGMTVPAHTRRSYNLGSYIETYNIATRVFSNGQVVCERAVYGPDRTWATESVGTTSPSDVWYLPEGCTGEGYESWILVQNPNDYGVTVNLALDTEMGQIATSDMQNLPVPAHTRVSYNLADYYASYDVATEVTSEGGPVVAERSMYGPDRTWAHNSIGSPVTADTWYLAEGCTIDMDTWILVQNPNGIPVEVDLKYLTENGEVQGPSGVIPPFTRVSYNVAETVQSYNVSTRVTSKYGGVIAERSMYAPDRIWGTCSIGATTPAATWCLAEGCTIDMDTWILVANPGTEAATVSLALNTSEGQQTPAGLQDLVIPAGSRASFHLNDFVTTYEVSTTVTSDKPVVCERAMYGPDKIWADASIGFAVPSY